MFTPIAPGRVPQLLREIYLGRRSGMLSFRREKDCCQIRFVKGHIVHGESTVPELHLGEVMISQGLLTREDLARASEIVTREQRRLGQVIEALGIASADRVEDGLALHVREILVSALSWKEGTCDFEPEEAEGSDELAFPLKMSTGELILEAVRRVIDPAAIRLAVGDPDLVILPATSPLLRFQRISLTSIEGFVLSRVDGTLTTRAVAQITPLPALEVEKALFALLCTGVLEHGVKVPARALPDAAQFLRQEVLETFAALRNRNHFEILGVATTASDAEIKAAYFRLAKRYHPDVHRDPALADLRDKLEAVFFRVSEAFDVLSRARPAPSPAPAAHVTRTTTETAPHHSTMRVEDVFMRAEERMNEGRYWEAIALLGEVVAAAEGRLRRRARILLARAYFKYPEYSKQGEKELQAAIQEDPECHEAYSLLGGLYKRGALPVRAAAMYRKVLEIRPNNREAQTELLALGDAQDPDSPGMLKRMFGRS